MTKFYRNSAFKPYKAPPPTPTPTPTPMKTDHNSTMMMIMSNNNSSRSSSPPPPPTLNLFPLKQSFLRKEEEEEEDFRGRKQDERIEEEVDNGSGFSNLGFGLCPKPLKEVSLIQRYPPPSPSPPPLVLGTRKRKVEEKESDLVQMETSFKKRDYYQDMASTTSKQTCSSSVSIRSEQETFSSSIEIETSNNTTSTLTDEEQQGIVDRNAIEEGEIQTQRRTFLFEKRITDSDLGDFSRLLIPIKCAATFFPRLKMTVNGCQSEMLKFSDNQSCNWDIKYECWVRSKKFVLTKGWKTFVTHHKLRFNDIIRVYKFADDGTVDGYKRYGIDFYRPMKTIRLFGKDICVDYSKMDGVGFVEDDRQHSSSDGQTRYQNKTSQ